MIKSMWNKIVNLGCDLKGGKPLSPIEWGFNTVCWIIVISIYYAVMILSKLKLIDTTVYDDIQPPSKELLAWKAEYPEEAERIKRLIND